MQGIAAALITLTFTIRAAYLALKAAGIPAAAAFAAIAVTAVFTPFTFTRTPAVCTFLAEFAAAIAVIHTGFRAFIVETFPFRPLGTTNAVTTKSVAAFTTAAIVICATIAAAADLATGTILFTFITGITGFTLLTSSLTAEAGTSTVIAAGTFFWPAIVIVTAMIGQQHTFTEMTTPLTRSVTLGIVTAFLTRIVTTI
jgi:hypothetical protein